ncbi:hypothetical protein AUP68_11707 [Ilyonectria robusta]
MASASSSTWSSLGLGVAVTWVTLGLVGIFQPARSAQIFGVSSPTEPSGKADNTGIAVILGSRDFAVAAALFALHEAGKHEEMGTVILSTMIICGADIYLAWKAKRGLEMVIFTVGASVWGVIGLGLKGFFVE